MSVVDAYQLAGFQIRPGLGRDARADGNLQGFNLGIRDGYCHPAVANHLYHPRRGHDWLSLLIFEAAEQISREQGLVDLFCPIRPLPQTLVSGNEAFESPTFNLRRDRWLFATVDLQGVPVHPRPLPLRDRIAEGQIFISESIRREAGWATATKPPFWPSLSL